MKVEELPCTKAPCKNCPFTKDCLKGWLGEKRIEEILDSDSFTCHKDNSLQCVGHMLMKKEENQFYRTAKYHFTNFTLKGSERIFDSEEECIKHHS